MSCNGCRVLRKGCAEDCPLRPCLEWIKLPESQANATLFLAKFYGRAGLINLITSAASHLHPEIFKSLLYEACGRIINPVYGSVGLMCSGDWPRCQAAVEAVLQGAPLMMPSSGGGDKGGHYPVMPLQGGDIRHLSKDSAASFRRVRPRRSSKRQLNSAAATELMEESDAKFRITGWDEDRKNFSCDEELKRAPSQDSLSVETVEPALVNRVKLEEGELSEIELELTLGFNPVLQRFSSSVIEISDSET